MTNFSLKIIKILGHYLKKWGGALELMYHEEHSKRFLAAVKATSGRTKEELSDDLVHYRNYKN